jgi:peptidoglycan/LPS O-acetylase OafA/YrhL
MHQLILDLPAPDPRLTHWLTPLQAGWVGVQLFFVLSGFLITGILLDTRDASNYWSSFFMRRSLRIFPPYYLLLILFFLVLPALGMVSPEHRVENQHQSWYWFYVANWYGVFRDGEGVTALGNCWSLSVEEQFYLIWPFVVRGLRPATLARVCVAIVAGALLLRIALVMTHVSSKIVYENTFTRADALAVGALVALLIREPAWLPSLRRHLTAASWLATIGLLGMFLASGGLTRTNGLSLTLGHTLLAAASGLLILLVIRGGEASRSSLPVSLMSGALIRLFGRRSYAIYLFHGPLNFFVAHRLLAVIVPRHLGLWRMMALQGAYLVVGCFSLLGGSMVFERIFERPILGLKRLFVANLPATAPADLADR